MAVAYSTLCNFCLLLNLLSLLALGQGKFSRRHNIEEVFDVVKLHHETNPVNLKINLQHITLKPRLRDYQKLAVRWMLTRERYGQVEDKSLIGMTISLSFDYYKFVTFG